ncbi:MAG: response regulator [Bacteroidetes bacterium]|nr:response regulator [Bacteroidota bacterium]
MTILYIEDDYEYHNMVDFMLEPLKVKTLHAYSVQEGIDMLKSNKVSFILSDINMEGMDGLSFLAAIKRDKVLSRIPIVIVTGDPSSEKARFANEQGAVGFLSKPFTQNELAYLVKTFAVLGDIYSTLDASEEILMRKKQKLMMSLAKNSLERDFEKAITSYIGGLNEIFDFDAISFYQRTPSGEFSLLKEGGTVNFPMEARVVRGHQTPSLTRLYDEKTEVFSNDALNIPDHHIRNWAHKYNLTSEIILPFLNLDDKDFLLGAGTNRKTVQLDGFFWGFRNAIFSTGESDIIKRLSVQANPILSHLSNSTLKKKLF